MKLHGRMGRVASVLLVAAAFAVPVAPAHAADQINLQMWTFGDMGLGELIKTYETLHPNITITIKQSDYDAHHQALLTALAAGNTPDIAAIEVGYSSLFKSYPSQFTDLRKYGAASLAKNYLPWRWEQGVARNGTIIGIPTDVGGMALAYRKDLFAAAGLPTSRAAVSKAMKTWAGFIAMGKKYKAATGKAWIDSAGMVYSAASRQSPKYVQYYDQKTNKVVAATNPQIKSAWNTTMAVIKAGLSAKIGAWSSDWNAGMNNGSFAVMTAPAWMMAYIQGQAPDTAGKWDIASLPDGGGNWGGSQLAIPAAAQHPKEAYEFIRWALSPENQLEVFKLHGNFPAASSIYNTSDIQDFKNPFFSNAPVGKIYVKAVEAIKKPIYEGPKQRQIDTAIGNAISRVEQGKQAAPAAWADAMKTIKTTVG